VNDLKVPGFEDVDYVDDVFASSGDGSPGDGGTGGRLRRGRRLRRRLRGHGAGRASRYGSREVRNRRGNSSRSRQMPASITKWAIVTPRYAP
jgi:hypothetical protein